MSSGVLTEAASEPRPRSPDAAPALLPDPSPAVPRIVLSISADQPSCDGPPAHFDLTVFCSTSCAIALTSFASPFSAEIGDAPSVLLCANLVACVSTQSFLQLGIAGEPSMASLQSARGFHACLRDSTQVPPNFASLAAARDACPMCFESSAPAACAHRLIFRYLSNVIFLRGQEMFGSNSLLGYQLTGLCACSICGCKCKSG